MSLSSTVGCNSVSPARSSSREHQEQRQQNADEHGGEEPEDEPGDGRDHRDPELDRIEAEQPDELCRLDQAEHRDDDHGAERRLREVAEHATEEQGAGHRERHRDQLAELRAWHPPATG